MLREFSVTSKVGTQFDWLAECEKESEALMVDWVLDTICGPSCQEAGFFGRTA